MLYLTLEDDPFPDQEHDVEALLELVRSVARRDGDDRTVSELIRFQDALERLGLLWTPLDSLDKHQAHELVRNLHLELTAPGDMVYLKHSPAMRSYVVLRGTVLLTNNVLDREGVEGVRVLGAGQEFGLPLDPDLDGDKPVEDFLEYAKTPHLELLHDGSGDGTATTRGGGRKDGRAELLVIGRQDWISTLQTCRSQFLSTTDKYDASKEPDPLKSKARLAFNFPAKGRAGDQLEIAIKYLTERVAFCADLPLEQVSAMAAAIELRGLTVPGRHVFRRGRECFGEAYIMFTGTADQIGGDKSGDRLITEGDLFGDEYFSVAVKDVLGIPFRTATVMSRTAPCELLVVPARECRRLRAFVALRNSEKAMAIFDKNQQCATVASGRLAKSFFINLPRGVSSEIASLATFRTIKMNQRLAEDGDEVSTVFFVVRGECVSKSRKQLHQQQRKGDDDEEEEAQRYGPGDIVGWPYLMPGPLVRGHSPIVARTAASTTKPHKTGIGGGAEDRPNTPQEGNLKEWKRRSRRNAKEWHCSITVTTPAQVLSVPLAALLNFLSERAMKGLRRYIAHTHKQKLDRPSSSSHSGGFDDEESLDGESELEVFFSGYGGYDRDGAWKDQRKTGRLSPPIARLRPSTAPELIALKMAIPTEERGSRRPNTTTPPGGVQARIDGISGRDNWPRPRQSARTRWRWRVGLTDSVADRISTTPQGAHNLRRSLQSAPSSSLSPPVIWGYARGGERRIGGDGGEAEPRGGRCSCPMESCRVCSPLDRFERLRNTTIWAPSLPSRSTKPASAPSTVARSFASGCTIRNTGTIAKMKATPDTPGITLSVEHKPSTFRPATTPYIHPVGKAPVPHPTGGIAAGDEAFGGKPTLWGGWGSPSSKIGGTGDGVVAKGSDGAHGGTSTPGNKLAEGPHVGFHDGRTSPAGPGGAVIAVADAPATASVAPMSDLGVTIASHGRGGRREPDSGSEMSLPPAAATLRPDHPHLARLSCTLVQLSTRVALDPYEPSANLCLRILGSFACEKEATTRVSNLYRSILPPSSIAWLPCQGFTARWKDQLALTPSCTDHLFLLRKGIPVGCLNFNVPQEDTQKIGDVDHIDGSRVSSGSSSLGRFTGTSSSSSSSISISSISISSSSNDASIHLNIPGGVGRGYDSSIPAVFKAKGQQFALAFTPSADRVEKEWAQHQRKVLASEQRAQAAADPRIAAGKTSDTAQPRERDAESTGWASSREDSGSGSSSSSSSRCNGSRGSVSQLDPLDPPGGLDSGREEGGEGIDAEGIVTPNGDGYAEAAVGGDAERDCGESHTQADGVAVAEQAELAVEGGAGSSLVADHVDDETHGGAAVGTGANDSTGNTESLEAKQKDTNSRQEDETRDDNDSGAEGDEGTNGAKRDTALSVSPGPFFDELLDMSDTESPNDSGVNSSWKRNGPYRGAEGDGSFLEDDTSSTSCAGGGIDFDGTSRGTSAVLPWIVSRLGLLEQVEGCYESEAKAFKKAVEILEGKEAALSSTRMSGPLLNQDSEEQEQSVPARPPEQQHSPSPLNDNRACILPLYQWISLGDGGLSAAEAAIGTRSISDPSEWRRAGVDPFSVWAEQRARRLRKNLYNLLRAAGPREIRSRCGFATAEDGEGRGKRGKRSGRFIGGGDGGGDGGGSMGDGVGDKDFRTLGRKKAEKDAVKSARTAILRQNQRLIQTETNVRRRLMKRSTVDTPIANQQQQQQQQQPTQPQQEQHASVSKQECGSIGNSRLQARQGTLGDAGSVDGTEGRLGLGGTHGGGADGGPASKELRHKLRVQMNIERKRARLFEDIQNLPYIGTKKGINGTKGSSSRNAGRFPESRSTRSIGESPQKTKVIGSRPPAIVLRAPKVQAQTRLHAKPASSFFARVNAAAGAALAVKTAAGALDGDRSRSSPSTSSCCSSSLPSPQPSRIEQQGGLKATALADMVAVPHSAPAGTTANTSVASPASAECAANNLSAFASAWGSCVSNASDEQNTAAGSASLLEATISSGNNEDGKSCARSTNSSKPRVTRSATALRGNANSAGSRGAGRQALRGADGWSTARVPPGVCSLDGELMLLDGILHDRKVRTWVETTLVPPRKHRHHVHV